jgi:Na+-driven multidrug efflux pump/anti-sigma regulatory factor (Ser/Thr protein kinase)
MAVQQLNIIVDGVIVSNLVDPDALSAINLYQPIALAITSLCTLFGIGATIRATRALGERDMPKVESILSTAIGSVAVVGVIIAILGTLFQGSLVSLISSNERLLPYFTSYMQVMVSFSVITMLNALYAQIVSINGYPKLVTFAIILSSVINLLLDLLFVGVFDMGIAGSAYATVISVLVGLIYLIFKLRGILTYRLNPVTRSSFRDLKGNMIQGLPLIISNLVLMLMFWMLNTIVEDKQGADGMFALAICNNLLALGMMFSSGVGSAVMSIGGFLAGQHDMQGLRILVKKSVKLVLICLLVFVAVIELFPDFISNIYGVNSPELSAYTNHSLRIFVLMLPSILLVLMLANVYQMLGFLVLTPVVILTFPLTLIPNLHFWSGCIGQEYIWWAFPATGVIVLMITFAITEIFRAKKRNLSVLTLVSKENVEHSLNISVKADRQSVADVLPEVSSFLSSLVNDKERILSSNLCIEEIMLNIVDHGGERMSDHYFDLHICSINGELHISIKDDGIPFNPLAAPVEQQRIGLKLVHGLCEKIEYKYMYGQNMVFMTWTLN